MSLRRIKQRLAQAFLIALLLFGLWQIPLSAWLSLASQAMDWLTK